MEYLMPTALPILLCVAALALWPTPRRRPVRVSIDRRFIDRVRR